MTTSTTLGNSTGRRIVSCCLPSSQSIAPSSNWLLILTRRWPPTPKRSSIILLHSCCSRPSLDWMFQRSTVLLHPQLMLDHMSMEDREHHQFPHLSPQATPLHRLILLVPVYNEVTRCQHSPPVFRTLFAGHHPSPMHS